MSQPLRTDNPCIFDTSLLSRSWTNLCCFTFDRPMKALLAMSILKNDPHPPMTVRIRHERDFVTILLT